MSASSTAASSSSSHGHHFPVAAIVVPVAAAFACLVIAIFLLARRSRRRSSSSLHRATSPEDGQETTYSGSGGYTTLRGRQQAASNTTTTNGVPSIGSRIIRGIIETFTIDDEVPHAPLRDRLRGDTAPPTSSRSRTPRRPPRRTDSGRSVCTVPEYKLESADGEVVLCKSGFGAGGDGDISSEAIVLEPMELGHEAGHTAATAAPQPPRSRLNRHRPTRSSNTVRSYLPLWHRRAASAAATGDGSGGLAPWTLEQRRFLSSVESLGRYGLGGEGAGSTRGTPAVETPPAATPAAEGDDVEAMVPPPEYDDGLLAPASPPQPAAAESSSGNERPPTP